MYEITFKCNNCGYAFNMGFEKYTKVERNGVSKKYDIILYDKDLNYENISDIKIKCKICGFGDELSIIERFPI